MKITEPQARAVLKILVEECGHRIIDPRDGDSFVRSIVGGCTEFRFCGALGFGGKFKAWNDQPYVDCYPEHETPARLAMIEAANRRLAELFGGET